jgi:hypothetical protein
MAAIPYSQLKGQGYLYPTTLVNSGIFAEKTISIFPPTCSGSAYFTMEAVRLPDGFYDEFSSTPGLATFSDFVGIDESTLIKSPNMYSLVIPSGIGTVTFKYTPTNNINANTMYIRGIGGIRVNT